MDGLKGTQSVHWTLNSDGSYSHKFVVVDRYDNEYYPDKSKPDFFKFTGTWRFKKDVEFNQPVTCQAYFNELEYYGLNNNKVVEDQSNHESNWRKFFKQTGFGLFASTGFIPFSFNPIINFVQKVRHMQKVATNFNQVKDLKYSFVKNGLVFGKSSSSRVTCGVYI